MSEIDVIIVELAPVIDTIAVIQQGPPGQDGIQAIIQVQLDASYPTLECLKVTSSFGTRITSLDVDAPLCDCVLLESGAVSDFRPSAVLQGYTYTSPLAIPGNDGDALFLGQTGRLTNIVPSTNNGDTWLLNVARKASDFTFIYDPKSPIKLV
jgi:hypothetical protein